MEKAGTDKYYAVRNGLKPGIYESWQECQEQVKGYSGAKFKSFTSKEEAEQFIQAAPSDIPINKKLPFAYIDGSFSKKNNCYSWGGFIDNHGTKYILQGTGNAPDYMQYRNITGELRGALDVIQKAIKLEIAEINLYYDYSGIESWINGGWKCENKLSQYYKDFYERHSNKLKVNFIHVDGHTGIEGNEIADILAKEAAGVTLRKKEEQLIRDFKESGAII